MENLVFDVIGTVTPNMELNFSKFVDEALANPKIPALIKINSGGGSVDAGFGIYNQLIALPNPVYTLITGTCESIAGVIFMAADYERRFAFPLTTFMAHASSIGQIEGVTKARLRKILSDSEKLDNIIKDIILSKTKINSEELTRIFDAATEELKFYSEEFEQNGICRVITKFDEIPIYGKED